MAPVAMPSGQTSDLHHVAVAYDPSLLADLGIYSSASTLGAAELTIDIDAGRGAKLVARFDPASRRWELLHDAHAAQHVDGQAKPVSPRAKSNGAGVTTPSKRNPLKRSWTDQLMSTDHVNFLKSRDWKATALGPMEEWPISLQLVTHQMLADPRIACIYWGPERVAIYNHAYSTQVGLGKLSLRHKDVFPERWQVMGSKFDVCQKTGKSLHNAEVELFIERDGHTEEVWYNGCFIPLRDETGEIKGFYNSIIEITRQKLGDRRSKALNLLATTPNFHEASVWHHILDGLRGVERDIPMAVLYSAKEVPETSTFDLHLQGTLGITEGHIAAPQHLKLHDRGRECFIAGLRQAKAEKASVVLDISHGLLSEFLADGIEWRGFGECSRTFVITPLIVTDKPAGFLITGLNPRRTYDEDYQQFIQEVGRLSTAALASNIGFEDAKAREAALARELSARESFVRKLAALAPVGLYNINQDGVIDWANQKYWEITGLSSRPEDLCNMSFMDCIAAEDYEKGVEAWEQSRKDKSSIETEIRLKRKWQPPPTSHGASAEDHRWMLVSALPDIDAQGNVTSVMGSITDITHIKWAEHVQADAAENAKEARQAQEKFIDMTSHEMRNPLSAILQCADSITTTLSMSRPMIDASLVQVYEDILDSAQTISLCASHQKRIIDDILTVSKLDSSVLAISPVLMEPSLTAHQAMQMFEPECRQFDIDITFAEDPSLQKMGLTWVYCDPSRLTQILVNLLTNAIKFTKAASTRKICLTFGVCEIHPPAKVTGNPKWFGTGLKRPEIPRQAEWGDEPDVYLTFSVTDTGPGITAEEMTRLFNRFAQANAKTHVQYGGSGLGLFISRELAELQGGMIGASSSPGIGSTFAFYVKAPKASPAAIRAVTGDPQVSNKRRTLNRTISDPTRSDPTRTPSRERSMDFTEPKQEILLVEDNLVNQKVLAKQLRRLGHTVHIANHGEEALKIISKSRFWKRNNDAGLDLSVILMDWEMPVMDGLTATRRIRELEADGTITKHLSIIATTANARAEQIQMAFAAGIDDLLAKPFKVHDLMNKIFDEERHAARKAGT